MMEELFDPAATPDYRQQARQFLAKSREYLADGDLHQASEKGWGAAAWMAKAVATAQGWEYSRHDQFSVVLNNAHLVTGDDRLRGLRSIANELHGNYYKREFLLSADAIALDLNSAAELLDLVEPLT
jgi:hypothetical protein